MGLFKNKIGDIRTREVDGDVWFVGKDIASVLGYSNPSKAIGDHCNRKGVTKFSTHTNGGRQMIAHINESNVCRLIARSKLPNAEKFKEWLFDEVIPTIRKTAKTLESVEYSGNIDGLAYIKNNEIMTTSLKIANETGEEHSKVIRDIDGELDKLDKAKIGDISNMKAEITYIDSANRTQRAYEINEQLTLMLLSRYSAEFRYRITKAFLDMRATLIKMYQARALEQVLSQDNRLRQFVYVIGDPIKNIYKIGVAQNVDRRLKQLQTGNGTELELMWVSNVCSNAFEVEKLAHNYFNSDRVLNEWFLVNLADIVEFLELQDYKLKSDFSELSLIK